MNRSIVIAGLCTFSVWAMSGLAFAQSPIACSLISEKEALALVGGPLGEFSKAEQKPTAQNGHDHRTMCSFYPKGFDIRKDPARPPDRGVILELHAMQNNADAKAVYVREVGQAEKMAKAPSSPFDGGKISTRITTISGVGEAAAMEADTTAFEPKVVYHTARVHFLKGSVMGQMTIWKKAAPADDTARAAAKQIIAKLP